MLNHRVTSEGSLVLEHPDANDTAQYRCVGANVAGNVTHTVDLMVFGTSVNQSINKFISRHSTEARATVRLCRIKEKCLKTDLKCVNGWSSSTVQWKRVPKSRSSN